MSPFRADVLDCTRTCAAGEKKNCDESPHDHPGIHLLKRFALALPLAVGLMASITAYS